jgi:uncharacterized membrane protein
MFLWLVSIMLPAVCIAQSEGFYHTQLEKTGIYAQVDENGVEQERAYIYWVGGDPYQVAQFSNEQLDTIVSHIIDYLFTDQESFALTMNGVLLNGQVQDGVDIFSETSVSHMVDVKELFSLVIVLTIVFSLLTVGLGVYIILRRKHLARFLVKYSLIFYLGFLAAASLFLGWVALDAKANDTTFASQMWGNFHHILFPFQADKFSGSFFNDTLTWILSLDFFLAAVYTVLIIMAIIVAVWVACTVCIKRLYK